MAAAPGGRTRARDFVGLVGAGLLPVPWVLCSHFRVVGLEPATIALLSGMAILGGAFLLAWGTELAERDIPQALAILVLALSAGRRRAFAALLAPRSGGAGG